MPQLLLLVWVLTQVPEQEVCPVAQAHDPPEQVAPPEHTCPQAPQLFALMRVFTHVPSHCVRPGRQAPWHVPRMHTWPAAQAWPHAPQLAVSERMSEQAPGQVRSPGAHEHAPLLQVCPLVQTLPQRPQLMTSVCVFTSQPSAGMPLQLA